MLTLGFVVISVSVLILIAYPLIRRQQYVEKGGPLKDELDHLILQKESSYLNLKELEFDYRMGKLSRQDYERLRSGLERRTISLLKEIDQLKQKKGRRKEIDKEIEEEVLKIRRLKDSSRSKKK